MDYEHNEYFPAVGYTNVFYECPRIRSRLKDQTYRVGDRITPFVDALIAARPDWKFVCDRPIYGYTSSDIAPLGTFSVYSGSNEKLGQISTDTMYRDGETKDAYCYDTHRLNATRMRGSWSKSTKLKVAVKATLKAFTPKVLSEILGEKLNELRQTVASRTGADVRAYREMSNKFAERLLDYAVDYWEEQFKDVLETDIDMPALRDAARAETKLRSAYDNKHGVVVYLRGSDYIVVRWAEQEGQTVAKPSIVASADLSEHYRMCLGMLKLVEDKTAIHGIGVRHDSTTFFIMDKDAE